MKFSKTLSIAIIGAFAFACMPAHADSQMSDGDGGDQQLSDGTGSGLVDPNLPTDSAATDCDNSNATASRC